MVNAGKVSPDRLKSIVLLKWNQVVIEMSYVNIKEPHILRVHEIKDVHCPDNKNYLDHVT